MDSVSMPLSAALSQVNVGLLTARSPKVLRSAEQKLMR